MSFAERALLAALRRQRVVRVVSTGDATHAIALARRLVEQGEPIVEFTLRSPRALETIARVIEAVGAAVVGVGSILSPRDMEQAVGIGARFLVSPGATPTLLEAGAAAPVPFIPGVATPSEAMQARAAGYRFVKAFPAQNIGGPAGLAALAAPIADMLFMPTGGIRRNDVASWLALPCVVCCGCSEVAAVGAMHA